MRIGHASIDENGNIKNGKAGDQNNKEVCIREWYNKPWNILLRCVDPIKAEQMAVACENGCNNIHIGYDQNQRNTLKSQAVTVGMNLSRISKDCECDCSSFMTVCAECANIKIPYNNGNAPTTSTMRKAFTSTNMFECLTDSKYLTKTDYLKRGDILVKEGSHTVMVLDNGSAITNNTTTVITKKCIDISKYNIITDYKQMSNEVDNVFIRIGYRSYEKGIITEDTLFQKHITNCLNNNINVGIYFYDQSLNEQEAIEQANWVANKLKSYNIKLPIFIDSEYSNKNHNGRADNISKQQRTKNILAFCNTLKQNGYNNVGVYASDSWFKSMLDFNQVKDLIIWCARYSTEKPTISKYDIWQYGSELYNWANGAIDTNTVYNLIIKENNSLNGQNTQLQDHSTTSDTIKISNVVTATTLNVRNQPDTKGAIIGTLKKDTNITIFGYVKDWYMMDNDMLQWISAKYVKSTQAKVTATSLNYRQGAGVNNKALGQYSKNDIVNILNKQNVNGTTWYLCRLGEKFGWASGQYLQQI